MNRERAPAALALALLSLPVAAAGQVAFPHAGHQGEFEACTDCHVGIPTGEAAETFPSPETCTLCHDAAPEGYAGRQPTADSDLVFSHPGNFAAMEAAGAEFTCRSCHAVPESTDLMDVQAATAEACTTCHFHAELEHPIGGQDCALCHGGAPTPFPLALRPTAADPPAHVERRTGS
jgi:hypothetical protein